MSVPSTRAEQVVRVLQDVWHWRVHDERIGFRSDAWAVESPQGAVLIDPLPLEPGALAPLGRIQAICLTGAFHQRAAWLLRDELSVPVWAPAGAGAMLGGPDRLFDDGDLLPGALDARKLHGPTNPHFVFLHRGPDGLTAFSADLLVTDGRGDYRPASDEHHEDVARTRASIETLRAIDPDNLCPAHGPCGRDHPLRGPGPLSR